MKSIRRNLIFFSLSIGIGLTACKKKKDEPTPQPQPTGERLDTLQGELTTQRTLDPNKKYLLVGTFIVKSGGVLRIPAGTIIFGDRRTKGTLIIDRGGKIFAEGTAEKPIIFTSRFGPGERDRGDWGGIIILGRARVNSNANPDQPTTNIEGVNPPVVYGGNDDNDNSGVLRYVRIEYAGVALTPNNEVNSLTMGGVGSGTKIEYVQVSYGGDDGFEWFGGTVDAKYLVSFGTWDDDLDVDLGWRGRVQFALVIRDPYGADQSGSNGFECDNDDRGSANAPITAGVFSNVTVIGPFMVRGMRPSPNANYQNAIHLRRNASVSIFNSVIGGFPNGLRIDGGTNSTFEHYTAQRAFLQNNVLFIDSTNRGNLFRGESGVEGYWTNPSNNNQREVTDSLFSKLFGYSPSSPMPFFSFVEGRSNPDLRLPSGSPLASGADFTNSKLDGFFERVSFRGALRPDRDWTDGWCNFALQNAQY
ncbi:MAG: hypothetical protein NZ580_02640 [Bacteroidia bacterium]|nr:hypothetical protein [Bacteroidia bacterium]MDW8235684.1 hypothetical protein [Bacteroidia bacterium]